MQVCTTVSGNTASIASGNPARPSTQQMRMSLTPRCLQLGEDLHPELRALGFLKPQAEHLAAAVHPDPQREIARLALNAAAVADLEHQRVEEHHRVDVLQRPRLPRPDVIHDRVGDPADQVPARR